MQYASPGEMLLEEYLKPAGITQVALAEKMGVPIQRVNGIIAGRRAVTAETAILLSRALGTTAELWLNLQVAVDLWMRSSGSQGEASTTPAGMQLQLPNGARENSRIAPACTRAPSGPPTIRAAPLPGRRKPCSLFYLLAERVPPPVPVPGQVSLATTGPRGV